MTTPTADLDARAVRAAHDDLRRIAPYLTARQVERALRAAQAVYDADREEYVQRQVDEARLAGMTPTEEGMEIRLAMARETAAHLVMAARTYLDSTGAENYVEQTVTDRETGQRYLITFQRPGGKSPHELRREAEAELARYRETAERFADGGVAKRIAGILFEAEPGEDCAFCRGQSGTCYRCQAEALVNAIRAENLVVLTVEAADEIVRQARKAARR